MNLMTIRLLVFTLGLLRFVCKRGPSFGQASTLVCLLALFAMPSQAQTRNVRGAVIGQVCQANGAPGGTADSKIAACIAMLPSAGGIVDLSGLQTEQVWS